MNKFLKGFGYAYSGIRATFSTELNFRFHFFAMLTALGLGFFLSISIQEWLWVFLAIALVMALELVNTALEALANLVSLEFHPLVKKAKDATAGAVLVISVFALLVGGIVFVPKIWLLFKG